LDGSRLVRDELHGQHDHRGDELIQDRYMLRCLPQFLGPLVDGLRTVGEQLEVESNSANDNPLVDAEHGVAYHGGNFLGEYVGIGMDQVRFYLGLLVKHLDVQIGWISSSLFSNGLADCLIGNEDHAFNLGFKGLQLCGNSIMPLVTFLGAPLVDRFPTHAEQFNQNVNSQGYGAANLARQSIELSQQYLAIALMFAVQAVDLRSKRTAGHYDARACLSPATLPLYEAMRAVVGVPPVRERPYVWNDEEQRLDDHIARIARDIADGGAIAAAVSPTLVQLWPGAGSAVPVSPASGQNGRVR
jgi:phenylalanine ammonia-lyase